MCLDRNVMPSSSRVGIFRQTVSWGFSHILHLDELHTMAHTQRYGSLFRALQQILFMLLHFICFIIAQWLLRTGSDCTGDQANVVSRDNTPLQHAATQLPLRLLFRDQS